MPPWETMIMTKGAYGDRQACCIYTSIPFLTISSHYRPFFPTDLAIMPWSRGWSYSDTWLIMHTWRAWSCTDNVADHALITKLIIHWSLSVHSLIMFLNMQWSRGWSCTDHVADHALITWKIMHWYNYKFLVGTLRRQLDIFERLFFFFFHDPWRWQGLTRRKAGNAEIPHVRDWHKPCMSLWILHFLVMCLCSETSTFLTFNHWTKPSTKVLVEKWNETKYLESTFKEMKGIRGRLRSSFQQTHQTPYSSFTSFYFAAERHHSHPSQIYCATLPGAMNSTGGPRKGPTWYMS